MRVLNAVITGTPCGGWRSRLTSFCGIVFTLLGFGVLVKLGLWQLDRAEEKVSLMAKLEQRGQTMLSWPLDAEAELAGYRLAVSGQLRTDQALLLDNQVRDGQVGYRLLVPLDVSQSSPALLLDLGFVAASRDRSQLPQLPALPTRLSLTGRLYQPGHNPLSDQLLAEPGALTRIQALEWPALETLLQRALLPAVLMVETPEAIGFPRAWQPINLAPEKHRAYALQWFGLALGWLCVTTLVARSRRHQGSLASTSDCR